MDLLSWEKILGCHGTGAEAFTPCLWKFQANINQLNGQASKREHNGMRDQSQRSGNQVTQGQYADVSTKSKAGNVVSNVTKANGGSLRSRLQGQGTDQLVNKSYSSNQNQFS